MKSWLLLSFFAFVLCALAPAEESLDKGPAPALGNVADSVGIAVSPLASIHSEGSAGYGASAALSHYFTRRFGITADGEYLKADMYDLHEYGFRAGPTIRFYEKGRFQLFARGLAGYALVKATYTADQKPFRGPAGSYPYDSSFSFLVGGGTDLALKGPFSARLTGDFVDDGPTHNDKTRLIRFGVGLVYNFGVIGR